MNDIQQRLMELMDEIDGICKLLNLRYILGEKTAARAKIKHGFIGDEYDFYIQMPLEDVFVLKEYVERNLDKQRVIESWENNSALKRLIFHYVDRNSLLIDESTGEYHKYPGISITILVARPLCQDIKLYGCERYLMMINQSGDIPDVSWRKIRKIRIYERLFGSKRAQSKYGLKNVKKYLQDYKEFEYGGKQYEKYGSDYLAAWIQRENISQISENQRDYYHLTLNGQWKRFPDNLFSDISYVSYEGREWPVTEHFDEYMRIAVGKTWKEKSLKISRSISKNNIIGECDLPFKEYLDYIANDQYSLEDIIKERKSYRSWKAKKYLPLQKIVDDDFRKVRCSQVRIDLWYEMRTKMDEMKRAYENNDISELSRLMKKYLSNTDKFYAYKLGFFINDTLLTYAECIWASQGKKNYKDKVYALVPNAWKKMDLEAHLQKYLKE